MENEYIDRLIVDDKPILLVPKKIVNYTLEGSSSQYRQHFVLNFLQDENIKNMKAIKKIEEILFEKSRTIMTG